MKSVLLKALAVLRLCAIGCWTLTMHGYLRLRQVLRIGKWREELPMDVIQWWGKGLCAIMGIRVRFLNRRTGPMGDVIIANHLGFVDIPVIAGIFPAVFMIKMEIRRLAVSGNALAHQGHIFVERSSDDSRHQARQALLDLLQRNGRIIIFPEGRASPHARRLPFKPFSFIAAHQLQKSVEACIIDYLPSRAAYPWDASKPMFPQFFALLQRPRIEVSIEFLPVEYPQHPLEDAQRYHDVIESRLQRHEAAPQ